MNPYVQQSISNTQGDLLDGRVHQETLPQLN